MVRKLYSIKNCFHTCTNRKTLKPKFSSRATRNNYFKIIYALPIAEGNNEPLLVADLALLFFCTDVLIDFAIFLRWPKCYTRVLYRKGTNYPIY